MVFDRALVDRVTESYTCGDAQRELVDHIERQILEWPAGRIAREHIAQKCEISGHQRLDRLDRICRLLMERRVLVLFKKTCLVRVATVEAVGVEPDPCEGLLQRQRLRAAHEQPPAE